MAEINDETNQNKFLSQVFGTSFSKLNADVVEIMTQEVEQIGEGNNPFVDLWKIVLSKNSNIISLWDKHTYLWIHNSYANGLLEDDDLVRPLYLILVEDFYTKYSNDDRTFATQTSHWFDDQSNMKYITNVDGVNQAIAQYQGNNKSVVNKLPEDLKNPFGGDGGNYFTFLKQVVLFENKTTLRSVSAIKKMLASFETQDHSKNQSSDNSRKDDTETRFMNWIKSLSKEDREELIKNVNGLK